MIVASSRSRLLPRLGLVAALATGCLSVALLSAQPSRADNADPVVAKVPLSAVKIRKPELQEVAED